MPYHLILDVLFGEVEKLQKLCEIYYSHYLSKHTIQQSASISLYNTDKLEELARNMKDLILESKIDEFSNRDIQRLDFTEDFPVALYDFEDFLDKNFISNDLVKLKSSLNEVVVYYKITS